MFEAFCRHEALGWPSAYTDSFPKRPEINVLRRLLDNPILRLAGKKGQYGDTVFGNRLLPQPSEAYSFWDFYTRENLSRSYLCGRSADEVTIRRVHKAVRKLLAWQGRPGFAAKFTGPSRLEYLNSIFPDAKFVHVVRDGRAAVHSVLRVAFWRDKGGITEPFWTGGLTDADLRQWQDSERDPGVLAALQWKRILEIARAESALVGPSRYREIRYEDFVDSPHNVLREIYQFCDLPDSPLAHQYVDTNTALVNMNNKYHEDFSTDYIEKLSSYMEPMLQKMNYSG